MMFCFLKTQGLGGDSAGPTILLLAPVRKDVKEVFATFRAPSACCVTAANMFPLLIPSRTFPKAGLPVPEAHLGTPLWS